MRAIVGLAVLALAVSALPPLTVAKDRGCGNRLTTLFEAEKNFELALERKQGVDEARAAFQRAREKASEEGCLTGTQWDRGSKYDRDNRYREPRSSLGLDRDRDRDRDRFSDRRRFDALLEAGYRRGLNRDEFRELEDLRQRLER